MTAREATNLDGYCEPKDNRISCRHLKGDWDDCDSKWATWKPVNSDYGAGDYGAPPPAQPDGRGGDATSTTVHGIIEACRKKRGTKWGWTCDGTAGGSLLTRCELGNIYVPQYKACIPTCDAGLLP